MDGRLTEAEREHLVRVLEDTRERLFAAILSLRPEQWTYKPDPEIWSIAECCDHIGGAEILFLKMIQRRLIEDPDRAAAVQGKEKLLRKAVPNRATRVKVPINIAAYGHVGSPNEFVSQFQTTRADSIDYAKTTDDPLHLRVTPHFILGDFDGAQWLELVAAHSARHLAQIEEVKGSPGFPE